MKQSQKFSIATMFGAVAFIATTANAFDMGDMRGPMKGDNWGGMPNGPSSMNMGGPSSWGMPNNMNMNDMNMNVPGGSSGSWGNPMGNSGSMPWGGRGGSMPWGGNRGGNWGGMPWGGNRGGNWGGGGKPWGGNSSPMGGWGGPQGWGGRPAERHSFGEIKPLPPLKDLPSLDERFPSRKKAEDSAPAESGE